MTLILASQSPRRREILSYFSLPFEAQSSGFDEDSIPFEGDPKIYVNALAAAKALSMEQPDRLVLAADTIVYFDGNVYGKPKNADQAFEVLMTLAGNWHSVWTGIAIAKGRKVEVAAEETKVLFNSLTDTQAKHYHKALHCTDKAAGYAVQESGSLIVKEIKGCFYNVMGLPINTVNTLLTQHGMSLWNYLN